MAAPLYFLPGRKAPPSRAVGALPLGLQPQLGSPPASWGEASVDRGPDGSPGAILSPVPTRGGAEAACGYFPDRQRWTIVGSPDGAAYWFGVETASPPRPIDVQRPGAREGIAVELGDGQAWTVPVVLAKLSTLPHGISVDANGAPTAELLPAFESLAAEGEVWFKRINDVEAGSGTMAELFAFAVRLLQVNYRVGPFECSMRGLDLLSPDNLFRVVVAGCGFPWLVAEREAQKKTDTPPAG